MGAKVSKKKVVEEPPERKYVTQTNPEEKAPQVVDPEVVDPQVAYTSVPGGLFGEGKRKSGLVNKNARQEKQERVMQEKNAVSKEKNAASLGNDETGILQQQSKVGNPTVISGNVMAIGTKDDYEDRDAGVRGIEGAKSPKKNKKRKSPRSSEQHQPADHMSSYAANLDKFNSKFGDQNAVALLAGSGKNKREVVNQLQQQRQQGEGGVERFGGGGSPPKDLKTPSGSSLSKYEKANLKANATRLEGEAGLFEQHKTGMSAAELESQKNKKSIKQYETTSYYTISSSTTSPGDPTNTSGRDETTSGKDSSASPSPKKIEEFQEGSPFREGKTRGYLNPTISSNATAEAARKKKEEMLKRQEEKRKEQEKLGIYNTEEAKQRWMEDHRRLMAGLYRQSKRENRRYTGGQVADDHSDTDLEELGDMFMRDRERKGGCDHSSGSPSPINTRSNSGMMGPSSGPEARNRLYHKKTESSAGKRKKKFKERRPLDPTTSSEEEDDDLDSSLAEVYRREAELKKKEQELKKKAGKSVLSKEKIGDKTNDKTNDKTATSKGKSKEKRVYFGRKEEVSPDPGGLRMKMKYGRDPIELFSHIDEPSFISVKSRRILFQWVKMGKKSLLKEQKKILQLEKKILLSREKTISLSKENSIIEDKTLKEERFEKMKKEYKNRVEDYRSFKPKKRLLQIDRYLDDMEELDKKFLEDPIQMIKNHLERVTYKLSRGEDPKFNLQNNKDDGKDGDGKAERQELERQELEKLRNEEEERKFILKEKEMEKQRKREEWDAKKGNLVEDGLPVEDGLLNTWDDRFKTEFVKKQRDKEMRRKRNEELRLKQNRKFSEELKKEREKKEEAQKVEADMKQVLLDEKRKLEELLRKLETQKGTVYQQLAKRQGLQNPGMLDMSSQGIYHNTNTGYNVNFNTGFNDSLGLSLTGDSSTAPIKSVMKDDGKILVGSKNAFSNNTIVMSLDQSCITVDANAALAAKIGLPANKLGGSPSSNHHNAGGVLVGINQESPMGSSSSGGINQETQSRYNGLYYSNIIQPSTNQNMIGQSIAAQAQLNFFNRMNQLQRDAFIEEGRRRKMEEQMKENQLRKEAMDYKIELEQEKLEKELHEKRRQLKEEVKVTMLDMKEKSRIAEEKKKRAEEERLLKYEEEQRKARELAEKNDKDEQKAFKAELKRLQTQQVGVNENQTGGGSSSDELLDEETERLLIAKYHNAQKKIDVEYENEIDNLFENQREFENSKLQELEEMEYEAEMKRREMARQAFEMFDNDASQSYYAHHYHGLGTDGLGTDSDSVMDFDPDSGQVIRSPNTSAQKAQNTSFVAYGSSSSSATIINQTCSNESVIGSSVGNTIGQNNFENSSSGNNENPTTSGTFNPTGKRTGSPMRRRFSAAFDNVFGGGDDVIEGGDDVITEDFLGDDDDEILRNYLEYAKQVNSPNGQKERERERENLEREIQVQQQVRAHQLALIEQGIVTDQNGGLLLGFQEPSTGLAGLEAQKGLLLVGPQQIKVEQSRGPSSQGTSPERQKMQSSYDRIYGKFVDDPFLLLGEDRSYSQTGASLGSALRKVNDQQNPNPSASLNPNQMQNSRLQTEVQTPTILEEKHEEEEIEREDLRDLMRDKYAVQNSNKNLCDTSTRIRQRMDDLFDMLGGADDTWS